MTRYLISFHDEWLSDDLTEDDFREASRRVRALRTEMDAAGVLLFTDGLNNEDPAFSVDASSGTPVFSDGPYAETKEHLGGFAIVDVADEAEARMWAGKVAVACGWPQEVRPFRGPGYPPSTA